MNTNEKAALAGAALESAAASNSCDDSTKKSPAPGYTPWHITVLAAKQPFDKEQNKHVRPLETKVYELRDGQLIRRAYPKTSTYKPKFVEVKHIRAYHELRCEKAVKKDTIFIPGAYVGGEHAEIKEFGGVSRTCSGKPGKAINFVDREIGYATFDIDKFEPFTVDPLIKPVEAIREWIEASLPGCFLDISFDWALSSSHGLKYIEIKDGVLNTVDNSRVLKAHVTFKLKTAYHNKVLEKWAKGTGADCTVFRCVQPIYIAAPEFPKGYQDPITVRDGFWQGGGDEVDLIIEPSDFPVQERRDKSDDEQDADMRSLPGVAGLFSRTFSNEDVVTDERLLGEHFLLGDDPDHFDWHEAPTPGGCFLRGDCFIGCNNNTWMDFFQTIKVSTWKAFVVLRFGHLDNVEDAFEQTEINSRGWRYRPSYVAAESYALGLEELVEAREAETRPAAEAVESGVAQLLEDIASAKTLVELKGPIATKVKVFLTENPDQINKARLDSALQARMKKLGDVNIPIGTVRALTKTDCVARQSTKVIIDRNDQLATAQAVRKAVFLDINHQAIAVRTKGSWFVFNDRCYEELTGDEPIRNQVWAFLGRVKCLNKDGNAVPVKPDNRLVTGVVDALRGVLEKDVKAPPVWMPGAEGADPRNLVIMANGILDIATGELLEHTPRLFAVNELPYAFDPAATCPDWMTFLDQVLPGDTDGKQLLQEWFGYNLTADTSQQKFMMLVGPKRSGKGTVGHILEALLGGRGVNTIAPTMSSISEGAGLEHWIGKLAAVVGDARGGGREPQTVVERILSITGEDTVSVRRLYRGYVNLKLPTRITILSNEMLRLGDNSGALVGRMLILSFNQSFYGKEDTTLESKLNAELPGILNWALAGKRSLAARGRFVQAESGRELLEETSDANSPVDVFVRECCELDPEYEETVEKLFGAWLRHCRAENRKELDKSTFIRNLKAGVPTIKKRRPCVGGKQQASYAGIRLNAEARVHLEEFP